jgi:hypothetical protein
VVVKFINTSHIHTQDTTKNTRYRNNSKFSLSAKVLELFLKCPILVLMYKQEF